MSDKILISRQAYEKLMELVKPLPPCVDAEVSQLYYNESCRAIQARIERWFDCA